MTNMSAFINEFLNIYLTLSKFQKKVFRYLQWFSKKFRCVFPCLSKIANAIGSCTRTVKRATKYFEDMGWILKKKRGYQSNLYFMNNELINLDLNDDSIFLRPKCPENVPVLCIPCSDSLVNSTDKVPIHKELPKRTIPFGLKNPKLGLSKLQQQEIANEFSEQQLVYAFEEMNWYQRQGNRIRNFGGYIWKACMRF